MNFFQRRKILRKANYLELTPVKLMEHRMVDETKADILVPRFKRKFWREVYRQSKKGEYIFIHLDVTGTAIWLMIDGNLKVLHICQKMAERFPADFQHSEDTEKRVTQFLSLLYQQRYITFNEIISGKNSQV